MKRTPLTRKTPLRSVSPLRPVAARRRAPAKPIPLKVRKAVWERSGGLCECGCGRTANHIHHRRLRSQGGRHELPNLLHLNHECHEAAHANPERGYTLGMLVYGWQDPAVVPVTRQGGNTA